MRTEPDNKKSREGKSLWVTSRKVTRVRLGRSAEVDENELSRRVTDQAEDNEGGVNEPLAAVNREVRRYGKRLRAKTRLVTRVRVDRSAEKDVNQSKLRENELRWRETDQTNDDEDDGIREPTVPVKREARSLKYTKKPVTKVRFRRSTLGEENSDQALNSSDNRAGNHDDDEMNYHRDRDNEDRDDDDGDDDDDDDDDDGDDDDDDNDDDDVDDDVDDDDDDDDDEKDDDDIEDNDDRKSDGERNVINKNDFYDLKDAENKVKVLRLKRGHYYKEILCARTHLDHYCN